MKLDIKGYIKPNLLTRGRPVEQFYWTSSVEMFITFFNEIGNSKTFEANLQNSSRRPVESRGRAIEILQGGPPDQMILFIRKNAS